MNASTGDQRGGGGELVMGHRWMDRLLKLGDLKLGDL